MPQRHQQEKVSIRPGVSVLSVLRHLNYKPWFAIAEFVDNALQSFLTYRHELERLHGAGCKLKVGITLERSTLVIRDNAAGIHESDYARAFRPAAIPLDRTGLSEFGMGMKSAACWFAPQWRVRTSALGEDIEKTVSFDIATIVRDSIEELAVVTQPARSSDDHYTEITLEDLYNIPVRKSVGKIKDHLASIYRMFIRDDVLELTFNEELLWHVTPNVLTVPYYATPNGEPLAWKKELDFDFGRGLRARGFAALRERASTSEAGFALFRRRRLIQGSADEGYRPEAVFGKSNSYRYQRLFGELELEGFEVSHTKDGFAWDENEEAFLQLLKEKLDDEPLPLLKQAEEYRVRAARYELRAEAEAATERTAQVIQRDVPSVLVNLDGQPASGPPPASMMPAGALARRVVDVELNRTNWRVVLELTDDPAVGPWLDLSDGVLTDEDRADRSVRTVGMRLALAHPFTVRFGGADGSQIEPMLRLAAAIGLAEAAARDGGVSGASTIRRNVNELLRSALSRP